MRAHPSDVSTHPVRVTQALPHWSGIVPFVAVALAVNALLWTRVFGLAAWYYDQQRIIQVVSVLLVAGVVSWSPSRLTDAWGRLPRVARWATAAVFALGFASAARSEFPHAAFRELGLFALLVVTALVVSEERRRHGVTFDRVALLLFTVTAMTYVLTFLAMDGLFALRLVGSRENVFAGYTEMWGFDNPRFFGQVGYWMFPALVAAVPVVGGPARSRRILWAVVVLWGALVIESGTRSAVYALLAGGLGVWLVQGRSARGWLRTASLVAGASVVVWFLIYGSLGGSSSLTRIVESGVDDSGRFPFWADAWNLAARHPFLGVGPEHYAHTPGTQLGSPHNVPLQLMAEWGIPAAVIIVAMAGWGVWTWLRGLRDYDRSRHDDLLLRTALGAALTAGGAASLVEGTIISPLGGTLVAITAGWMLGMHFERRDHVTPAPTTETNGRLVCVAASIALLVGALPYAVRPGEEVARFVSEHRGETLTPRFWLIGRLAPERTIAGSRPLSNDIFPSRSAEGPGLPTTFTGRGP